MNLVAANIGKVRKMFLAMEKSDFRKLDTFIAPDYLNHESIDDGQSKLRGPAEFKETTTWLREAFVDIRFEVLDVMAFEDQVFVRTFMQGMHVGEFFGNSHSFIAMCIVGRMACWPTKPN